MAATSNENFSYISKRAQRSLDCDAVLLDFFVKASANPFNAKTNPGGTINMGTSENKLVMDIWNEKLSQVNLKDFPDQLLQYNDMRGIASFRKALAAFLNRYMAPAKPINEDDLYLFNGCGSVLEMLGFTILDDGDCVMIPAPYYGAFRTDLAMRMGSVSHSIELTSEIKTEFGETEPFELSLGRMELAYNSAISMGRNVRAIILSNPNNPLGYVYSKAQLISYLQFANKYKLHVLLDEIYFLSMYEPDVSITTGLSLSDAIDPNLLHIVWGFSKDFAASGFRCGLVHTVNSEVGKVLSTNSYFQSVPTLAQYILQSVVEDFDWLNTVYFPTNKQRLRKARDYVCNELESIGVKCLKSVGGLYVWADFRDFVRPLSRDGEMKLMEKFLENGVYITAGLAFEAPEHGWFRIIFSVDDDQLIPGIRRIKQVLLEEREIIAQSQDSRQILATGDRVEAGAEERLDDLVAKLQNQISNSDWLANNTAEQWVKENPELASKFLDEKNSR